MKGGPLRAGVGASSVVSLPSGERLDHGWARGLVAGVEGSMQTTRREAAELFSLLDGAAPPPAMFARSVLKRILLLDPSSTRAQQLLGCSFMPQHEDELLAAMEEAEAFAVQGLWHQARRVADRVERRFGFDPVARAWLDGIHVLWDS